MNVNSPAPKLISIIFLFLHNSKVLNIKKTFTVINECVYICVHPSHMKKLSSFSFHFHCSIKRIYFPFNVLFIIAYRIPVIICNEFHSSPIHCYRKACWVFKSFINIRKWRNRKESSCMELDTRFPFIKSEIGCVTKYLFITKTR